MKIVWVLIMVWAGGGHPSAVSAVFGSEQLCLKTLKVWKSNGPNGASLSCLPDTIQGDGQ